VCCQVVSATVRSLVQRNPTESEMSECDRETSTMRPRSTKALEPRNIVKPQQWGGLGLLRLSSHETSWNPNNEEA